MNIRDIAELAWERIKTRSLRFLLTVTGIGAGVGVVLFLVSLGFGLQEVVIGRIATSESLLSLSVVVSDDAESLITITDDTLGELGRIPGVEDVSPLLSVPTEINLDDLKAQTLTQAVRPSFFRYAGINATAGRLLEDDDRQAIIASTTVLRLFDIPIEDAIGTELSLSFFFPQDEAPALPDGEVAAEKITDGDEASAVTASNEKDVNIVTIPEPFTIVGYIDNDVNTIFLPLPVFDIIEGHTYAQTRVRVSSEEDIEPVRKALLEKGYLVIALTDTLDQLNRIFRITQISLATMGIVALFIASVGMFNTLTISLLERTREVGILKALGATKRDVWMIFLFEAFSIGLLGGISGLLLGALLGKVVNILVNILANQFGGNSVDLFATPPWFLITIMLLSLLVGILTGLYPARRASRLNPLDALRHE